MRVRFAVLCVALTGLIAPATASADCVHVVTPGESLTSIAAADGLTVDELASANGLSPMAGLIIGSCLTIPPQGGSSGTSASAADSTGSVSGDGDNDSDDATAAPALAPAVSGDADSDSDDGGTGSSEMVSTTQTVRSYVVQPGDTLTAIAAQAGVSVEQLAAANGLDPSAPLLSASTLRLSGSAGPSGAESAPTTSTSSSVAMSQPVGAAAQGSAVNPPYPTPQTVSSSEVGSIAAANGVPPALADAIAYQESGFNSAAVSPSDARGVMQILPGTWDWINQTLTPGASPLSPASATDNIRGGVLLLHSLLNATSGNAALAAAGYYQGLPSVEQNGMYADTQQYVNNVLALQQRFNGGG